LEDHWGLILIADDDAGSECWFRRCAFAPGIGASTQRRLTPREQEILGPFAAGLGTQAVSEQLQISTKTLSSHTQRLLPKLGVHSRTEAVALAYREGLFETAGAPRA
jgi:two-component system nitrate/nitrite response regulator NarL